MASPLAGDVMAATYKLVQQAMNGRWQEVPKTIEERRVLLDRLEATASAQDRPWLEALKQAMAESDAAVAKITELSKEDGLAGRGLEPRGAEAHNAAHSIPGGLSMTTKEWLNKGR